MAGLSGERRFLTQSSRGWLSFTRSEPNRAPCHDLLSQVGGVSVRDATAARQINGRSLVCGMELISPRWLMTACHCVLNGANTGYEPAGSRGMSQVSFLLRPAPGIVCP